jgi:P27 family predicted phage terminase small subunit
MPARKPTEAKRRTGRAPGKDSAGRPIANPVRVLPGVGDRKPAPPEHLGDPGRARWVRLWAAAEWFSPLTDLDILVRLCEAEDLRWGMKEALAATGFMVKGSMGQSRVNPLVDKLRALDDQITKYEVQLGLTPAARGALIVGVVDPAAMAGGALDDLLRRAANRGSTTGTDG